MNPKPVFLAITLMLTLQPFNLATAKETISNKLDSVADANDWYRIENLGHPSFQTGKNWTRHFEIESAGKRKRKSMRHAMPSMKMGRLEFPFFAGKGKSHGQGGHGQENNKKSERFKEIKEKTPTENYFVGYRLSDLGKDRKDGWYLGFGVKRENVQDDSRGIEPKVHRTSMRPILGVIGQF